MKIFPPTLLLTIMVHSLTLSEFSESASVSVVVLSQAISQLEASQAVSQLASWSVSWSVSHSVSQSVSYSVSQFIALVVTFLVIKYLHCTCVPEVVEYLLFSEEIISFSDITEDFETVRKIKDVYQERNNVDLWVGGLAEDHEHGSELGPTFRK